MITGFAAELNGARIAGETRGHDPRAVFLHGFGGSGRDWDRVWTALPAGLAVLRYDQRGFGRSKAEEAAAYSHRADLLALLDARGIAQADLIGLSQGGSIACHFALEHPHRVRRLVLVSPALYGWKWSEQWRSVWRAATAAAGAGDIAGARAAWSAHPMFTPAHAGPAGPELAATLAAFPGRQWLADPALPETPDVDRLDALTAPTLLLTGTEDVADFRQIAAVLEQAVPGLRRVDLPGAGHLLNLERTDEVAREIAAFLQ
ncbi:MAG: alpha/beta fold hydrolase [Pseudomonadota bacterium]